MVLVFFTATCERVYYLIIYVLIEISVIPEIWYVLFSVGLVAATSVSLHTRCGKYFVYVEP